MEFYPGVCPECGKELQGRVGTDWTWCPTNDTLDSSSGEGNGLSAW